MSGVQPHSLGQVGDGLLNLAHVPVRNSSKEMVYRAGRQKPEHSGEVGKSVDEILLACMTTKDIGILGVSLARLIKVLKG